MTSGESGRAEAERVPRGLHVTRVDDEQVPHRCPSVGAIGHSRPTPGSRGRASHGSELRCRGCRPGRGPGPHEPFGEPPTSSQRRRRRETARFASASRQLSTDPHDGLAPSAAAPRHRGSQTTHGGVTAVGTHDRVTFPPCGSGNRGAMVPSNLREGVRRGATAIEGAPAQSPAMAGPMGPRRATASAGRGCPPSQRRCIEAPLRSEQGRPDATGYRRREVRRRATVLPGSRSPGPR